MGQAGEVRFPEEDGARSTTATGRAVAAAAALVVDPALAERIRAPGDWRKDYLAALRALAAPAPQGGAPRSGRGALEAVARAGLRALHERLLLGDAPLAAGIPKAPAPATDRVAGDADPVTELVVPYRGRELRGDALRAQLADWTARGVLEPAGADAIAAVIEHPEWLPVTGRRVAVLGAGAELGPLAPLLAWGADVLAVDVPSPPLWRRVLAAARAGAGTLALPVAVNGGPSAPGDAAAARERSAPREDGDAGRAGLDLTRDLAAVRAWLLDAAGDAPLVVGTYAYAPGGDHVRVCAAADALVADLLATRPQTAFACLATPTDAFLVTPEIADAARARWSRRGALALAQRPLAALSGGRLFRPAYAGDGPPVADALVPQQGPNYALAKRVQRWRALAARADGHLVSCNVAPASMTRSVTSNAILAAAFGGAARFGVEAFAPATTRVLMAALLVHDLHRPPPAGDEAHLVTHAAHGGLWRTAYEPRSALGFAALAGLPAAVRARVGR